MYYYRKANSLHIQQAQVIVCNVLSIASDAQYERNYRNHSFFFLVHHDWKNKILIEFNVFFYSLFFHAALFRVLISGKEKVLKFFAIFFFYRK